MKGYIVASVIVGASIVFSSLLVSGNISFKNEHVISLSDGYVKLGNIYKENKLLDVTLKIGDNDTQEIISNGNPSQFKDDLIKKLTSIADDVNKMNGKSEDKLLAENLSIKSDATIEFVSSVRYMSENIPVFNLILERKTVKIEKGTNLLSSMESAGNEFIKSQKNNYEKALYLSK
ncbi:hypothetical protein EDWATA_02888 [Edwardsiella tarda ATCC 23685]|uniref:Uncharacterized protein n=1 Tax=Edwardsiella tarda ATCC 23685 TaxID=500638 RepID=D4F801_EDWTA|nr:hypothetical protein [Edwardsiella tarda]EFE22135.1 hypothetical protein EDWATA_02888 [Edwardsiella tarda ATCC 23685]GAC64045.1 hypothetical protein ET1_08_01180 [Edwardsiella tarda ATCC 15947 = NBRC 105688]STD42536.1 Uncharacterised protein [Edwardsiella tarda]